MFDGADRLRDRQIKADWDIRKRLYQEHKVSLKEREAAYWAKHFPDVELKDPPAEFKPPPVLSIFRAKKKKLLLREVAYRKMLALKLYEPLPKQKSFHKCLSPERIILGGNRGSKTMCCAAEVAMAVTGMHKYLPYPKENGRWMCIGKDGIKIGEVFYRKLFMPGAFEIVKDAKTGLWRAWRPWEDGWECERKPAPPLIPRRMVKAIAWEDKKLDQPKKITLTNGWEILFFTSAGKPMEGVDFDGIWFDEEIYEKKTVGSWYDECAARLIDREGRFIWSATPQAATEALFKLHERAEEERNEKVPRVSEFHVTMDDNPFLPPEAKDLFKHKASFDADEYRVRVLGEFLLTSQLVYPDFRKTRHVCDPFDVPHDWCRYLIVDPGYANVVGLFVAVPPPSESNKPHVYVYDEVYGHQWDAKTFATHIRSKVQGSSFQSFVMDGHGGRRTEACGLNIATQYAQEFEKLGIRSVETQSSFILMGDAGSPGEFPVKAGVSQVRSWLWDRDEFGGKPKLQVFSQCANLIMEMSKYRNKVIKGKPTDRPDESRWSHGPDAVRYMVLHGVPYVVPRKPVKRDSGLQKYLTAKLKKKRQQDGNYVLLGSTSGEMK